MVVATFLGLVIAIAVGFLRAQLIPMYQDLAIDPPPLTRWLGHRVAVPSVVIVIFSIPAIWFLLPSSRSRSVHGALSIILVILLGFLCVYALLQPLVGSLQRIG